MSFWQRFQVCMRLLKFLFWPSTTLDMPWVRPRKSSLNSARRWFVSTNPEVIAPGETAKIQCSPQCLFKGNRIINTEDTEGLFIEYLFVGHKMQLPTLMNPISVSCFDGAVLDSEIIMDTCDPALLITFVIKNESKEPKTFGATIFGKAVLS